ncbi:MAG: shikimate kinase [Pirellulales bacterium]
MNVALIGYRGTGKTTVAELVAAALGWSYRDADAEVEAIAGKSIAAIFAADGETTFRNLESAVVTELVKLDRAVLSLGGGVVIRRGNRDQLAKVGRVIWLNADVDTLWKRIQGDAATAERRPALTSRAGPDEIRELLAEREKWYRECAHVEIDSAEKSPGTIAAEIVDYLHDADPTISLSSP